MSAHAKTIVIVGHGAPPRDFPAEKVRRLRALESARRRTGSAMSDEEHALDFEVRHWPRSAESDPYKAGIERLAERVRHYADNVPVAVAYNEFCAPSVEACVDALVAGGVREVVLVATMMTPGGSHAEVEIPETVATLRERHGGVRIAYAWPFDLDVVARVLVEQAAAFTSS